MAGIVRIGIKRLINNTGVKKITDRENFFRRTIVSKATIPESQRIPKPKPWPYLEKRFDFFTFFFDKTSKRFDENSVVIVVDGPVAAGKSKLAKQLAEQLDMLYFPEANLDMLYINHYGFDLRKLDSQAPDSCKTFDIENFLKDPGNKLSARFQIEQYRIKFSQYFDALNHLFSTGQGVVLDRCCYSDSVFTEAMYSQGYLSKPAYNKYYEIRDNTILELLRPHLVIYLDVPVPKIIENVNKRAISYEKISPALTPKYLQVMENAYKQKFLKNISLHSELLVYDWSEEGDVDIVIEDIERIDFNRPEKEDTKLEDWRFEQEEDYAVLRFKYAEQKPQILTYFNVPAYDVPELIVDAEESEYYDRLVESSPGNKYEIGYNTELGDSGYLFKSKAAHRKRFVLPFLERRIIK